MVAATDPRVARVEENPVDFLRSLSPEAFTKHDEPDVFWITSDLDHPLFNGAMGARFAEDRAEARANEVLDDLMKNGRPFLWTLTPNTRTTLLEKTLVARGLIPDEPMPGMYADLPPRRRHVAAPAGVDIRPITSDTAQAAIDIMAEAFEVPDRYGPVIFEALCGHPIENGTGAVTLLATRNGRPAGAGSVFVTGDTAGLYSIAVREDSRRHGVGLAITRELMRVGTDHGCRAAVLTSSPAGLSVYLQAGFTGVCWTQEYFWPGPEPEPPQQSR
jgi:GNAT superfamily N-acetyltransferase